MSKILILEDDFEINNMPCKILRKHGHLAISALFSFDDMEKLKVVMIY